MRKKRTITVLIVDGSMDRQGDRLMPSGMTFDRDVPVYDGFKRDGGTVSCIGRAALTRRGQKLMAAITLSREVPVTDLFRAAIKSGVKVYPAVGGKILERGAGRKVTSFSISAVSIGVAQNADQRIKPLSIDQLRFKAKVKP